MDTHIVDSPIGRQETDSSGSPVGVVRMDVSRSYAGVGELLRAYINDSDEGAWGEIRNKIDYMFTSLDLAMAPLERETGFGGEIRARLAKGQKLLFKPNLVVLNCIDPQTHGPDLGRTACTEWSFVAALMRWFHDKLDISYYQMMVGEAATLMPALAKSYTMLNPEGRTITTEAVIEGKSGDFYGGWGFHFARKYLADSLAPDRTDDPMEGFEESQAGTYIPPGDLSDKLMVYDLNRIHDDATKGRSVDVPDGINFKTINLHKVIVGGDPGNPEDRASYPGSILVNVPRLKVHCFTLLTNVIKNLGIGLYPMQSATTGGFEWDYSVPHNAVPGMKGGIPHQVWVPEMDFETGVAKRDDSGRYLTHKTGGITATMIDIIKAVVNQDIFMIHVVDGIEAINLDHQGMGLGKQEPEGIVFAGLDPVATDLLSARYLFGNVPLHEALKVDLSDGAGGRFPQSVPIPRLQGKNIVTEIGYDCPLSRDVCFENAEKRGLGVRSYYVVGGDAETGAPLVSVQGHLGRSSDDTFSDVITQALYFDIYKLPWDLQKTTFHYLDCTDQLAGSTIKKQFLDAFDENGDGIVTYEEFGRKGVTAFMMHQAGDLVSKVGTAEHGNLKGRFRLLANMLKCTDSKLNSEGHDIMREFSIGSVCVVALRMSQADVEAPDPFSPGLTWGRGKWPSFQLARFVYWGAAIYGIEFPNKIGFPSLYGSAFLYADLLQNEGRYAGPIRNQPDPEAVQRYMAHVASGEGEPLDFVCYFPEGFDNLQGTHVPNVEITNDPLRLMTASFTGGREVWPDAGL